MLRLEIAAVLFLVMAAGGAGGIWYAHHEGYEAGRADQVQADQQARQQDQRGQAHLVAELARLRAASRAAAAAAERELGQARGPCLDRPLPAAAVRSLQRAGVRTAAPGSGVDPGRPRAGPAG